MKNITIFLILVHIPSLLYAPIQLPTRPPCLFFDTQETLKAIKDIITQKKKGIYLRFGDGDINLANGSADMLQKPNHRLAQEMREAFLINSETALKALPVHNKGWGTHEQHMFPGNHESNIAISSNLFNHIQQLTQYTTNQLYSAVALHYQATYHPENAIEFLRFLKTHKCVLIGNKNIPRDIVDLLFGTDTLHVPTPEKNSYSHIDAIEKTAHDIISKSNEYTIVVTAMGCSGRILQKRLWHKHDHIFLFDFGSLLDALCGWDTRAWISLSKFNKDIFKELLSNKPKVLYTAALIDNHYEMRKQEYCNNLQILNAYGYTPFVIESVHKAGRTFFDETQSYPLYTRSNNAALKNKGVNEFISLKKALDLYHFNDNDMLLKITGRYFFTSDAFLKNIENHPEVDAWIKYDTVGQVFTGCFALRTCYFKQLLRTINFAHMEKNMICIERIVADFIHTIQQQGAHIESCDLLNLTANIFGDGNCDKHFL